jgi:hypothetical protein
VDAAGCDLVAFVTPQITCLMPANYGVGHPLVVSAAGQTSSPYSFTYDAPIVRSVEPENEDFSVVGTAYDAKAGTDVIVSGQNFGDAEELHGMVSLNGTECSGTLCCGCAGGGW